MEWHQASSVCLRMRARAHMCASTHIYMHSSHMPTCKHIRPHARTHVHMSRACALTCTHSHSACMHLHAHCTSAQAPMWMNMQHTCTHLQSRAALVGPRGRAAPLTGQQGQSFIVRFPWSPTSASSPYLLHCWLCFELALNVLSLGSPSASLPSPFWFLFSVCHALR